MNYVKSRIDIYRDMCDNSDSTAIPSVKETGTHYLFCTRCKTVYVVSVLTGKWQEIPHL